MKVRLPYLPPMQQTARHLAAELAYMERDLELMRGMLSEYHQAGTITNDTFLAPAEAINDAIAKLSYIQDELYKLEAERAILEKI